MKKNFRLFSCVSLALTLGLATGCPGDDGGSDGSDETSGDTTGGTTNGSMSTTTSSTTDDTTASTTATTGMTGSTTMPPDPLPNGEMCEENAQCESEMCFVVGILGGICGECLTDDDCPDGGCSIPNPLASPIEGAMCNMGEQGEGCMSDEVCMDDQVCAEILAVPGVLEASTCSECVDSTQCTDQLCNPTYNVLDLSGFKTCVDPLSVGLGEGCTIGDEGNMACESTFCGTADVMGLLQLGVCSECLVNEDCDPGQMCNAPEVDLAAGLVAGVCEDM